MNKTPTVQKATAAALIQTHPSPLSDDATPHPDTSRKPNSRPPVDPRPHTINRPEHFQDSVNCLNLYHQVDDNNELEKYLVSLPGKDDAFKPMDVMEIGVARVHKVSSPQDSILDDPTISPKIRQLFFDCRHPYLLFRQLKQIPVA